MGLLPLYIFNSFSAGIDFGRQILTSYIKPVPALEGLITPWTHSVWNTNINIININNAKGPLRIAMVKIQYQSATTEKLHVMEILFLLLFFSAAKIYCFILM